MGGYDSWRSNPAYQIVKRQDPYNPEWCAVSQQLVDWGTSEVARVVQDPYPDTLLQAKARLLDYYAREYSKTTDEHRPEKNRGMHACIHAALIQTWRRLDDIIIQAPLAELEQPVAVVPTQPDAPPEPSVREEPGIDLGDEEAEPAVEQESTQT